MIFRVAIFLLFIHISITSSYALNTSSRIHPKVIERFAGVTGSFDTQKKIFTVKDPRGDLIIIVNGVTLIPAMGLTSLASFSRVENETLVKADLVVTENQVNAVMETALANHFIVTTLHNHFLWETPKVMFMHIEAKGDEKKLAMAINSIFKKIKATSNGKGDFPLAMIDASNTTLNPKKLDYLLGAKGSLNDGAYVITLSKGKNTSSINDFFNANTSAIFAGSDDEAVVEGDLVMRVEDLQSVLSVFHQSGIAIVAIHELAIADPEQHILSLHYWGVGRAEKLARGVRIALTKIQNVYIANNYLSSGGILNSLTYSTLPNGAIVPEIFSIDRGWCWRGRS